jgi:hypothetical protein
LKFFEYLTIDPVTRRITVPQAEQTFGVQSDTQAVRKYFKCPRYVGTGLDLAGMFIRVNFRNANGEVDAYLVDDVAVDGEDVTFSWLLSKKATAYVGQTSFVVCAVSGRGLPEWNTTLAVGNVLQGLEPDSSTAEAETADVIAQLLALVEAQTGNVEAVGAAQVKAVQAAAATATTEAEEQIQAKGAATLATIPEDYATLAGTVDRLTRDRAAAIVCRAEGTTIQVADASNDPLRGLRIFGRSTQDGTPTPDNPVEIVSLPAPVVTVTGKNLLEITATSRAVNGGTITVNTDKTIVLNGTVTQNTAVAVGSTRCNGECIFSVGVDVAALNGSYHYLATPNGNVMLYNNKRFIHDGTAQKVYFVVMAGAYNNVSIRPMIRTASVNDDTYEPYKGQTLTITTPGSLPGIPVESGGNYTDADGQQWVCDEVDLARGVYVQRVGVIDRYAGEEIGASYMSTTGDLVTGASVLCELATPVEKPLTDVELQAFRTLHSCKPTTTVLNDAGAHMVLEYAADPKTYIDNKLAALVAGNK